MTRATAWKLTLISLSVLSASFISIKVFDVHFHFDSSMRVEKVGNRKWTVRVPNNSTWIDTGIDVPYGASQLRIVGEGEDSINEIDVQVSALIRIGANPGEPIKERTVRVDNEDFRQTVKLKCRKQYHSNSLVRLLLSFED